MILSHHGKYEFGSPKLPMTPEAVLLSALDDVEAEDAGDCATSLEGTRRRARAGGDDEWVRSMERPLLNSRAYLDEE